MLFHGRSSSPVGTEYAAAASNLGPSLNDHLRCVLPPLINAASSSQAITATDYIMQSGKGDDIKAFIPVLLFHVCSLSLKETCQFTSTMGGFLIHSVEILLIRDAKNYLNSGMAFITAKIRRRGKRSNCLRLLQLLMLQ
eukprot:scaffold46524_cov44-Cyclotella_meneghiniana.AAC.7